MKKFGLKRGKMGLSKPVFWRRLKQSVFGALAVLMLGTLVLQPTTKPSAVKSADTATPRFNFLPGDLEMLKAANITRGDTGWSDPTTANIGDRVALQVYFHNGVLDSVAHDVSLRVDLPENEVSQIKGTSWLWSVETSPISDTVVNGQIVGASGITINLPSNGRVQYVSGSTKIYDSQGKFLHYLPDGITDAGINIGDIAGCWQYAGFVTFMIDIKGHANLTIDKKVGHLNGTWENLITAVPGETVAYQVRLENTGNARAAQVVLKDQLSPYLTYVNGSTRVTNAANPNGVSVGDDLFKSAGLPIPDMAPGAAGVTYVTYKVKVISDIPGGWWTLNNLAKVFMAGVEQGQAQAAVKVFGAHPGMTITKSVFDGVNYVEHINAKLGDIVTYKIIVANTGNTTLNNVVVRDIIPIFTEYVPGSTLLDNVVIGDQLVTASGIRINSIMPNEARIIDFKVKIIGCPPVDAVLVNTAYVKADGMTEIHDSASVTVKVTLPVDPIVVH